MKKYIFLILFTQLVLGQGQRQWCATPPATPDQIIATKLLVEEWLSKNSTRDPEPVHILVAWHVIHTSAGAGNISDDAIYEQIDWLNQAFLAHNIFFTVDSIDRTENNDWFDNWYGNDAWPGMQQLNVDPYHYLNVYTANLWDVGAAGWAYLGNGFGPSDYRQSVNLDFREVAWGNDTSTHEVGHHLGLNHTFYQNCTNPNDGIDDTPQNHEDYLWQCTESLDSCPDDEGNDPVHNYMTYTSSACQYEFTQGQEDWMHYIIENYHPGYYDNLFNYPDLYISDLNYQFDTDGDGVFNPGDSLRIRANVGNYWGADADSVFLILSTEDDRLVILDSTVQFENPIAPGEISFTLFDWFQVFAEPDASLGNISCNINISTSNEDFPYETDAEVEILLSLNQYGFPIDNMVIKSSPLIADVDGNLIGEVYFGDENGDLYGYMIAGIPQPGFPFSTGDNIRSSPAVGDVDADGNNEIVFGSYDGKLYILSTNGAQELAYTQSGYIIGSPALVDLDGDSDLEIVFTTQNGNSGMVYAIHHDGNTVDGFPADIDEKMLVGAAVGDLEGDGSNDIVVCTWGDNIYAIDNTGTIKEGFPFTSTNRFNAPPTLVDLDGDGDLEIVAGNDSGLLHVLHHDGTEMTSYDVGDDIRGGISVADLNDDGSYELLFTGYDDMIHVWNPMDGAELDGWPVDMNYNSLTEPVTADLDNDGDLEVVTAMKSGMVYIFHHDATLFNGFPTNLSGNIESSPAIGDLDGDGDYEIAFGTTSGLQVFDIKTDKGNRHSWKLHRGNLERSGLYDITLTAIDPKADIIPDRFYVSPNYPNPFNPVTQIDIYTVQKSDLTVNIFDATGRLVNTLIDENLEAGSYSIKWQGKDRKGYNMPTGVYFIQVESGAEISTQKMVLIK